MRDEFSYIFSVDYCERCLFIVEHTPLVRECVFCKKPLITIEMGSVKEYTWENCRERELKLRKKLTELISNENYPTENHPKLSYAERDKKIREDRKKEIESWSDERKRLEAKFKLQRLWKKFTE